MPSAVKGVTAAGARSSADQSIGLRSQGSWVRIPPGAPAFSRGDMRIAFALVAALFAGSLQAQTYPSRPLHFVVPFPVSGATDILARVIAAKLQDALGQPVPVDNKPGAGGTIGSAFVAKSAPDGYTILMATTSTHSIGPALQKLPYDHE